jgi:diguanylate cyclase (GGDEF)-like protein
MGTTRRARRRHLWQFVAALIALVGVVISFVVASNVVANHRDEREQARVTATHRITEALERALAHQEDLILNANAEVALRPDLSTSHLRSWAVAVDVFNRYPEVAGITFTRIVRPEDLAAHIARVMADPPGTFDPAVGFQLAPAGDRPFYCLSSATVGKDLPQLPVGFDFCAAQRELFLKPRDLGQTVYVPYEYSGKNWLAVSSPVFVGGGIPTTPAAREAMYLGVVGTAVQPKVIVDAALEGHADVGVVMRFDDGSSTAEFSGGTAPAGAVDSTVDIGGGWTLTISQPPTGVGLLDDSGARGILAVGTLLGLLVAALVHSLGTGRARALRMVAKTTSELRYQALHDPLTGLANRALLVDRMDQLLARCRRNSTTPAALYLDLDGFKSVNDSLGHDAGDRLLEATAARLAHAIRGADTIARMGGDEFVVLLDGGELDVGPELVAERLLDILRHPFELEGSDVPIRISASIGIATGDRDVPEDLIRDADVALYEAKGAGKNGYAVFRPEMEHALRQGIELEFDLRSALERGEYRLLYQPIYDLGDLTLIGVEALLRWQHPTLGLVYPDQFIPVLERTGMIVEVGRWVLNEACAQMAEWHRRGSHLGVSVNVSARQFDSDGIVDDVERALRATGLDPTSLTVEVTESAVMRDTSASVARLEAIKELGVQVAIDDFGTGYSSLASLQRLPVDSLKIDRSFISALAETPESRALVRTIVQLGRDLGLTTLAEGVETAEQVDLLRGDEVNNAQGFLLARPLDAGTIERTILFAALVDHPGAWNQGGGG